MFLNLNSVLFISVLGFILSINVESLEVTGNAGNAGSRSLAELLSWMPSAMEVLRMNGSSPDCKEQAHLLLQRANQMDLQALQMLDAWAKAPSGVLSGNSNQLGDFDECVAAGGRYCLASLDVQLPAQLTNLDRLAHAHYAMSSSLSDPGHRIPKFSLMQWGTCLPSGCGPEDLEASLRLSLAASKAVTTKVKVDPDLCHFKPSTQWPIGTVLACSFFTLVFMLCVIGTVNETKIITQVVPASADRVLSAFSFQRNLRSLLDMTKTKGEVRSLNGVRALNALALLISHKQMALLFLPFINRTQLAQWIGRAWSMSGRSAILYTDSFILVSGLLTARTLLRQLSDNGKIDVREYVLSRFIRLGPSLAAVIVLSTFILPDLGSGPLWGLLVTKYASLCRSYWWRNLLFIHNHFPFDQMCLTHSHQVGIDMQLSLTAPLLLYPLWKWPRAGLILLFTTAIWSSFLRYTVAIAHQLSTVIYYGIPISQLFRTAKLTYILPSHRATVYCLGIGLGYFLHRYKTCSLTYRQAALGWTVGVSLGLVSMFGPYHMAWPDYVYNAEEGALYNVFAPVLWSTFVGWGIFATHYGYGGWFGALLEWKWFSVFTKLSYAVYLTQFPIFFFNVGRNRTAHQYSLFKLLDLPEFAVVLLASLFLTVMIDMPAQNLKKSFLPSRGSKKEKVDEDEDERGSIVVNKESIITPEDVKKRNRLQGL